MSIHQLLLSFQIVYHMLKISMKEFIGFTGRHVLIKASHQSLLPSPLPGQVDFSKLELLKLRTMTVFSIKMKSIWKTWLQNFTKSGKTKRNVPQKEPGMVSGRGGEGCFAV